MASHGGVLPTVEECLDARNPDNELTNELVEVYYWLWLECFPATAHRSYWGKSNYFEVTPSACMPGNSKHRAYVSIASEAYFYLQLENNHTRWTRYHQEKVVKGNDVTATMMRSDPRFKARYSQPFNGQEKFRGFSDEGLHRFEELKKIVKTSRAKDLSKVTVNQPGRGSYDRLVFGREQHILTLLRGENQDKVISKNKRRKRKAEAPEVGNKKRICSREEVGEFNPSDMYDRMNNATEGDDSATESEDHHEV